MHNEFIQSLKKLCELNKVALQGSLRIIDATNERWDATTISLNIHEAVQAYGGMDRTGPFLVGSIEEKPAEPVNIKADRTIHINPDIAGYDCPVSGKWIGSRKDHRENLKRQGCRNLEPGETRDSRRERERNFEESLSRTAHEAVMHIARNVEV
jgi:hypothetical protein